MPAEPNYDLSETIVHSHRVAGHPPNGQNSDVENIPLPLMKHDD